MGRQWQAAVGAFALALGGCGGDSEQQAPSSDSQQQPPEDLFQGREFEPSPEPLSGLRSAADPEQLAQNTPKQPSGQDPFAGFAVPARPAPGSDEGQSPASGKTAARSQPSPPPDQRSPTAGSASNGAKTGSQPSEQKPAPSEKEKTSPGNKRSPTAKSASDSTTTQSQPDKRKPAPPEETSPARRSPAGPPPEATESELAKAAGELEEPTPLAQQARALRVTGIVQIGGSARAIVELPEGAVQRVSEGDVLADGHVRIKQIAPNRKPAPAVVLAQQGQQVIETVGSNATVGSVAPTLPKTDAPAAQRLPPPPPSPTQTASPMANASAARPQPPRQERIRCPKLSLAVYCEVAAHLRQVEGVQAELIPQQAQQFDYERSQTLGLRLTYSAELDGESKQRAEAILAYYARHYGPWQRRSLDAESD